MNKVLRPFLRKFVTVFFDNVLVYNPNRKLHHAHLQQIFEVLRTYELYVNKKKCCFNQSQLEYLGYIIFDQGVVADPNKVKDMLDWPIPTDIQLERFPWLTGYYW